MKADTDHDNIPDGYIDGWRYLKVSDWKNPSWYYMNFHIGGADGDGNDIGIIGDYVYLEGEDVNLNGEVDSSETNPLLCDTDEDHINDDD